MPEDPPHGGLLALSAILRAWPVIFGKAAWVARSGVRHRARTSGARSA
jgi:hypothetical protein